MCLRHHAACRTLHGRFFGFLDFSVAAFPLSLDEGLSTFPASFWAVCELLIRQNMLSPVIQNQLIPICCWVTMAVSLNLVVGISGELSLGHAGFMSIGAFTGLITAG